MHKQVITEETIIPPPSPIRVKPIYIHVACFVEFLYSNK